MQNLTYSGLNVNLKTISGVLTLIVFLLVMGCDSHKDAKQNSIGENRAQSQQTINVVSPDWGNAATLTAMGYPPIATGDMRVWDQWVGKPKLPNSVIDLGIRYQPNAELVAQLPVDMVIDNFFYKHARNLYGDVPAESVLFASHNATSSWNNYVEPTQKLGQLINQPDAARNYIVASRAQIEQAGQRLHQRYPMVTKFAVVQFIDANNIRMYASNSLFNTVFSLMNYDLVALAKGNSWGFTSITLGDLAKLDDDVCLLVIEPLNPLTEVALHKSLVWQRLGYGKSVTDRANNSSRCMAKLAPVWIYGGMSSLTVLADNLASTELTGGNAK